MIGRPRLITEEGNMDSILRLIYLLMFLWLALWFFILLPAKSARERNRSPLIWVLISLFGSTILAILLLIALGDAPSA